MEPTQEPLAVPSLMIELATFINRMPINALIKRLRIAVTEDEYAAWMNYGKQVRGQGIAAIRAVPLQVEEHPEHPMFILEYPHE